MIRCLLTTGTNSSRILLKMCFQNDTKIERAAAPVCRTDRWTIVRVTIKDVAKEAGVSVSTVSYALNRKGPPIKESHKRVLAAVEKLGYVPDATARSLVNSRTNNFAVIIGYNPSIEQDPYDIELISCFSTELAKAGCWMSLYMDDHRHSDQLEALLIDAKTDGIVMIRGAQLSESSLKLIERRRLPLVTYESYTSFPQASVQITVDPRPGVYQAIDHLLELGHRKIGAFSFRRVNDRFQAAEARLAEAGLEPILINGTGLDRESAYLNLIAFLDSGSPLPTAIITPTDLTAIGTIRALTERGIKVPEEVSIIGYDDIYEARHASPPLTTISQNIPSTVEMICRKLIDLRDRGDSEEKESITIETTLVVRDSTAPPRKV